MESLRPTAVWNWLHFILSLPVTTVEIDEAGPEMASFSAMLPPDRLRHKADL